jgi:hypothetical protein
VQGHSRIPQNLFQDGLSRLCICGEELIAGRWMTSVPELAGDRAPAKPDKHLSELI